MIGFEGMNQMTQDELRTFCTVAMKAIPNEYKSPVASLVTHRLWAVYQFSGSNMKHHLSKGAKDDDDEEESDANEINAMEAEEAYISDGDEPSLNDVSLSITH
jgi:hypothetical protein